jgi:hypothetical protein
MSNNVKNNQAVVSPTKIVTGVCRLSYANIWQAKSINGGAPKFSTSVLIPKSDTATVAKVKAAIAAAYSEGEAKLKGTGKTVPPLAAIKTPMRDGDLERPDDEAYQGHWFVNANSKTAPGVVDINREPIFDTKDIYSGVYARVCLSFYAFNSSGNKGVACGLQSLHKIKDGEPLGGRSKPEDDFNDDFTSDDDDYLR